MNAIQSNYPPHLQTYEQRKAAYDSLYDKDGNMRTYSEAEREAQKAWFIENKNNKEIFDLNKGHYSIAPLGDDYVAFYIDTKNGFGSGGGRSLTAEEQAYLRGKYDMDNLSEEDRIRLLAELSCMGVIDGHMAYAEAFPEKTYRKNGERVSFGSGMGVGSDSSIASDETDLAKWIELYLKRAREAQENVTEILNQPIGMSNMSYLDERRKNKFYSELAAVLNQLSPVL